MRSFSAAILWKSSRKSHGYPLNTQMDKLDDTNLLNCRIKWIVDRSTDENGLLPIGGAEMRYVISAGLGGIPLECYVAKIFRNTYDIWYAEVRSRIDDSVAKNVAVNMTVFYNVH